MTLEAAHDDEPGPVSCGAVRRRMDYLASELDALLADLRADPGRDDAARRIHVLTVAYREAGHALAGHVFRDAFAAEQAPATEPLTVAGRHRASPAAAAPADNVRFLRDRRPRPVHVAPGVALLAFARHAVPHATHVKIAVLSAAVAGAAAASVTYTVATMPDRSAAPATSAAPVATVPADVEPSAVPSRAALVRHHHRAAVVLPSPALTASPPAASSAPAPSAPAPVVAAGVLQVQDAALTLQPGQAGQYSATLTLEASGGPVTWQVDPLGTSSVLSFDQSGGTLQPGQPVTVTVTIDAGQVTPGGQWEITLDPGGQPVTVTAAS